MKNGMKIWRKGWRYEEWDEDTKNEEWDGDMKNWMEIWRKDGDRPMKNGMRIWRMGWRYEDEDTKNILNGEVFIKSEGILYCSSLSEATITPVRVGVSRALKAILAE